MNIQPQSNVSFGAIPRASYKLASGEVLRVLEIEPKDLPFIRKLSGNMETFLDKHEVETVTDKRLIIDSAFKIIKEMLEKFPVRKNNKTHMYVAECDSDICGVLVGGLPKKTPSGELRFSSRGDAPNCETELNWLATWTPNAKVKRKGVGKILMSEYADTFEKDGFKNAFIQSEIPSLSFAQKFYEKLGFKALSAQKPHSMVETNKDVVHCVEDLYDYEIVPMLGSAKSVNDVKDKIFTEFQRIPSKESSVDMTHTFKLT